jgi:hypothetical protein
LNSLPPKCNTLAQWHLDHYKYSHGVVVICHLHRHHTRSRRTVVFFVWIMHLPPRKAAAVDGEKRKRAIQTARNVPARIEASGKTLAGDVGAGIAGASHGTSSFRRMKGDSFRTPPSKICRNLSLSFASDDLPDADAGRSCMDAPKKRSCNACPLHSHNPVRAKENIQLVQWINISFGCRRMLLIHLYFIFSLFSCAA